MVKIRVIGGSPEGSDSLCKTCTLGHVIKGFRASEELVFYRFFYIEREIHFPVRECTFYEDRRLASMKDMEEIAWMLTTIKPTRHVGFASAVQFRQMQEAAENPATVGQVCSRRSISTLLGELLCAPKIDQSFFKAVQQT